MHIIHGSPVSPSFVLSRKVKSPAEMQAETCEDSFPCRFYAYHHGIQKAYQRYFNAVNQPQRAAGIPQY